MGIKKCNKCGEEKPLYNFYRLRSGKYGVAGSCKICTDARRYEQRKAYRNTPAIKHSLHINYVRSKYGISEDDLADMLHDQGGCCAICEQDFGELQARYHIDHNHITGEVRGLLCPYCNTGLGYIENNLDVIPKALEYLKEGS